MQNENLSLILHSAFCILHFALALENSVLGVLREGQTAQPGVPSQPRADAVRFAEATQRNFVRLEQQLHVEIKLRPRVETDELHEQKDRLAAGRGRAIRQEFDEIRIGQRPQADAKLALHIPDALSRDAIDAESIIMLSRTESGLVVRLQPQPLSLKLPDAHRVLKIILKQRFQRHGIARALYEETTVMQENQILDAGEDTLALCGFPDLSACHAQAVAQRRHTQADETEQTAREGVRFAAQMFAAL